MKNKEKIKRFLKYIFILLSVLSVIGLIIFILIILRLVGVIQEYKYLKIDDYNKEQMTLLLNQQEDYMFNKSNDLDLNKCVQSMKKIEVEFLFPDGEDYIIFCNDNKYEFSLDNGNYDLSMYISENGKHGYRFRNK